MTISSTRVYQKLNSSTSIMILVNFMQNCKNWGIQSKLNSSPLRLFGTPDGSGILKKSVPPDTYCGPTAYSVLKSNVDWAYFNLFKYYVLAAQDAYIFNISMMLILTFIFSDCSKINQFMRSSGTIALYHL